MRSLVITAHDYRSRRKVNMHFIAAELKKYGETSFFSCQYSFLSQLKSDPRSALNHLANKVEVHDGVRCFLWKTFIHPINLRKNILFPVEKFLFSRYVAFPSPVLVEWIKQADIVFFESGIAPIFFDLVQRLNPLAKTVYIASDDLDTINVASYVKSVFARVAFKMDALCLTSRLMAEGMPGVENCYVIPHGFDFSVEEHADPSPYDAGLHAVSVGSMLFDPLFFVMASRLFPEVTFHIIGCGRGAHPGYEKNVIVHEEMRHQTTLPYIKHAAIGIAPYRSEEVPRYLSDTSMKLMQYDFFKLPAVCPASVVGDYTSRFGYIPGNADSIAHAMRAALSAPRLAPKRTPLRWSEVVERMLAPETFSDTGLVP
ncbi:glycosyltransferase family 1 protein [Glaciimonas sp. PCH181]|uniref:GumK N-terminal domain-containing glycosyltransferase n=1 Tax=Glaciimonas sp. PCH181 TaxID=2133943 RepID=UPI000D378E93|nr:glycosyltransferase family 1 protein [Glaciimonas sp. PCH181]PUA18734.1 UDP-glucuronate--glycolipid 2-beta-glucuronosyltransferase [Glaciimonas sp. PCH181]